MARKSFLPLSSSFSPLSDFPPFFFLDFPHFLLFFPSTELIQKWGRFAPLSYLVPPPHTFLFLISSYFIFFFILFFFTLFGFSSTKCIKSGGNFPPLSSFATCLLHIFLIFSIFLFPFFPSIWHIAQYEPFIQVPSVNCYTTWPSCHVSISQGSKWHPHGHVMCHPTPSASKNVKF